MTITSVLIYSGMKTVEDQKRGNFSNFIKMTFFGVLKMTQNAETAEDSHPCILGLKQKVRQKSQYAGFKVK